jgi:hypothetical protein
MYVLLPGGAILNAYESYIIGITEVLQYYNRQRVNITINIFIYFIKGM